MAKKNNSKVKLIRMRNGYVESNTCSVLELYHDVGLPTRYDALKHLAAVLFTNYEMEYLSDDDEDCCKVHKEAGKRFCPDCGSKLSDLTNWPERFFDFIRSIHGGDSDSTGSLWFESLNPNGWNFSGEPFGIKEEEALVISAYGAEALFLAAYEIHWSNEKHKKDFIDYVTGDHSELPHWWWQGGDYCNQDIKRFAKMINDQDIN